MLATVCILNPDIVKLLLYRRVKPVVKTVYKSVVDISDTYLYTMKLFTSGWSVFANTENNLSRRKWEDATTFAETQVHE